jgi:hypothetical protein
MQNKEQTINHNRILMVAERFSFFPRSSCLVIGNPDSKI